MLVFVCLLPLKAINCFFSKNTGFEKYRGGLDTVHDLTGELSVYTNWRNIEIMFHVSTYLPYEKHDPQKVRMARACI